MADAVGAAMRLVDDVRDAVAPQVRWPAAAPPHDPSLEGARARAELGRNTLARLAALEGAELPRPVRQALAVIRSRAEYWTPQPDWYWTVFDPSGGELFAMFAPTAYGGGWVLASLTAALRRAEVATEAGQARYLAGLHEVGDRLDAFAARTRGQAERGVFMPRAQAEGAMALLVRLQADQPRALGIGEERLAGAAAFRREVDGVVARRVAGGLAAIAEGLDPAYFGQAKDAVGMMHYPDGAEIYAALVRLHGSTDLSPREVHEVGLERVAAVRTGMAEARRDAGFDGCDRAYRDRLDADPDWRAETPEALAAVFARYVERFRPHVPAAFNLLPRADYGARAMPEAMSGAMTFGYYEAPSAASPRGDYLFNAANLARANTSTLASLTYHELVPGHHLHLALQHENDALPALRQWCMPTAYVEGWAEYAVTLAEETGMFQHPAERFGRFANESFLACRLVVDTGLNALGWSLEQARAYMRENSFFGEAEIASETLRYGADIPGQALAYKLGDRAIMSLREAMRTRLGARFDIRDFHDVVLGSGALPIPVLAEAVAARTAELAGAGG